MGGQSLVPFGVLSLMSAPGRQKCCKHGNQASTTFGYNLSKRTCSACFLGMSAKFRGPAVQEVAPGEQ
eukprot:1158837-Pelagomonas_calceolata.AAC.3